MPATATSEITAKAVGEEIRRARRELALTQRELAQRLGTSQAYVANVEAGRENVTLGKLAQLAAALGAGLEIRFAVVPRAEITVPH
jgi:transcriptional regulator with XRE-family HTH domain